MKPKDKPGDFSHFDSQGNARMVDVSEKSETKRIAIATGKVTLSPEAYSMVQAGTVKKGDVLSVARLAGIMASKETSHLIPLCHPLMITSVDLSFELVEQENSIKIEAKVSITGKTGVEMEALTAVSVAALTIYDMCKAVDKGIIISDISLLSKTGGKSGSYLRNDSTS